jgi:hypothetical protein
MADEYRHESGTLRWKSIVGSIKAGGSTAPKVRSVEKISQQSSFDSLISGIAFDLREGPVCQSTWFQGAA